MGGRGVRQSPGTIVFFGFFVFFFKLEFWKLPLGEGGVEAE